MHFALMWWLTAAAHADAVAPPDCPEGARAHSAGHGVGGCEPWPCDDACPEGSCRTIGLCYVDLGDRFAPEPAQLVVGNCDEPGICLPDRAIYGVPLGDGYCDIDERCVVAEAPPASAARVGPPCGCGTRRDAPGARVALGVIALAVVGRDAVRRRRRSRAARR